MSSQAQNQGLNGAAGAGASGTRNLMEATVVDWAGSSSQAILNVTTIFNGIPCGTLQFFVDGNRSQTVNCQGVDNNSLTATYTAEFNDDFTSGTLMGDVNETVSGQPSTFEGIIGTWDCNTSQSAGSSSGS
jgi:hypothetical protein